MILNDKNIKLLTEMLVFYLDDENFIFSAETIGNDPHIFISKNSCKNEDEIKINKWVKNELLGKYPNYKLNWCANRCGYNIRFVKQN